MPVTAEEARQKPVALEKHLLNTPVIARDQVRREIVRMAQASRQALEQAAEGFNEPDKTFMLDDVSRLKIQLEGMAISDIVAKMNVISLPELGKMNANIQAAKNANSSQSQRVEAFKSAFNFIKSVIGIII